MSSHFFFIFFLPARGKKFLRFRRRRPPPVAMRRCVRMSCVVVLLKVLLESLGTFKCVYARRFTPNKKPSQHFPPHPPRASSHIRLLMV